MTPKGGFRAALFLQLFEGTLPQQAFCCDVAVLDFGREFRFNPRCLRFLSGLVSFDFGLTTVSSASLILRDVVRFQPVPTLPM
jgi:hypothetical protein